MNNTLVLDGEVNININVDGESDIVIAVGHETIVKPIQITENGHYEPSSGVDGFSSVDVDIPLPTVQSKIVEPLTTSQTIEPDEGYDYLSSVTVDGYFNPFKYDNFPLSNAFINQELPETLVIDFENAVISSIYKTFNSVSGCKHLTLKNIQYPDNAGVPCQDAFRGSSLEILEFVNCTFKPANNQYPFYQSALQEVIGDIDMTYRTAGLLNDMTALREVRFVPNTIHGEFTIYNTRTLSNDSLISIANGLSDEATGIYDIRRTNTLPTMQNITGNVVDSMFIADDNGSTTLEQFITNVKGWTIRNS